MIAAVDVFWKATTPQGRDSLTHKAQLDGDFAIASRTVCGQGLPDNAQVGSRGPSCRRCVATVKRLQQERQRERGNVG